MRKRPFVLLEILIALLIVMLCLSPLIREPLKHYQTEMQSLEELEKQRIADWTFTEIQEQLLKNEIPWDQLPARGKCAPLFALSCASMQIPGCAAKPIPRYISIRCHAEKKNVKGDLYKLLYIHVLFSKDEEIKVEAAFRLIVQKLNMP